MPFVQLLVMLGFANDPTAMQQLPGEALPVEPWARAQAELRRALKYFVQHELSTLLATHPSIASRLGPGAQVDEPSLQVVVPKVAEGGKVEEVRTRFVVFAGQGGAEVAVRFKVLQRQDETGAWRSYFQLQEVALDYGDGSLPRSLSLSSLVGPGMGGQHYWDALEFSAAYARKQEEQKTKDKEFAEKLYAR